MLRVTIELIPHGDISKTELLGRINIINDGTGNLKSGSYKYDYTEFDDIGCGLTQGSIMKEGSIKKFNRVEGFLQLCKQVFSKL